MHYYLNYTTVYEVSQIKAAVTEVFVEIIVKSC